MHKVLLNYDEVRLYLATSQGGGEGQGGTHTDDETNIQTNLILQTDMTSLIETAHPIRLVFSWIIIQ